MMPVAIPTITRAPTPAMIFHPLRMSVPPDADSGWNLVRHDLWDGVFEQVAPCGDHAIWITQIVPVDIPYGQYGQIGSHGREYVAGEIHRRQPTVEPLDRFSFSQCSQHGSKRGKGLVDGRHGLLDELQNGGRATHHDEAIPEPPLGLELLGLGHRGLFPTTGGRA